MASIICFGASYIQKLKDFWAEESDFCDFLYKLRGGFPSTVHLLTLSMHTKHTSKISNDDVLLFRRRRCEVIWLKNDKELHIVKAHGWTDFEGCGMGLF